MNNVPHVKLHLNKRSLKLSGQTYAVQQKKLERVLAEQLEDLELKEQATAAKRTREQVLADLVAHQELVIGLLEQQQEWLAALLQDKEDEQHIAQQQPGSAAFGGNSSSLALPGDSQRLIDRIRHTDAATYSALQLPGAAPVPHAGRAAATAAEPAANPAMPESQQQLQLSDTSGGMSYVAGLLANASPAQLRRVMEMTAADWQQYKHDHFMRLVALLELVNRPVCLQEDDEADLLFEQQQQQLGQGQQQQAAAGSAATSVAGRGSRASGSAATAPAGLLQDQSAASTAAAAPFDFTQRFQDVVDEGITLSFLALFFNHLSIVQASTNTDLPQQAAPPGMWLRVVRKLDLTDQQLLQLRIASEEFTRLNRSCSQEAESLMGRANRPSLLLAAEASIQAAASITAASGSSGSSSAARGASGAASGCSTVTPAALAAAASSDAAAGTEQTTSPFAAAAAAATSPPAAAAAEGDAASDHEADDEDDDGQLDGLLQRHLRLRFLYMVMIGMFVFNTLSRVQIAQMTVSCYPYYPMLTAVAEAAATLHKQKQHEDEKRIRAKRRQRLFNDDEPEQQQRNDDEDDSEGDDGDDSRSSRYARQQLRQHQQQRNSLLQRQQAFWQQQLQRGLAPMQG